MTDERNIAELYCRTCRQTVGIAYEKDGKGKSVRRCLTKACGKEKGCERVHRKRVP